MDIVIKRTSAATIKVLLGTSRSGGSMRYPDPHNAKDLVKQAGYLASVGRDEVVIARPPLGTARPHWYAFDADLFRGAARGLSAAELAFVLHAALVAADAELAAMQAEIATAQATATDAADPAEVAARLLLQRLSPAARARVLAEFAEVPHAV